MKHQILFCCTLVLLIAACTPTKIPSQAAPRIASHNSQPELAIALQQENYQKALMLLRREQAQGRSQEQHSDAWSQALNGLIFRAELHLGRDEYSEAGLLYREVSINFPTSSALADSVIMDQVQLKSLIEDCADHLLGLGLLAYRQGELREAVAIWSKIDRFHPQHEASQRALATTRLQLHNLEALPTK